MMRFRRLTALLIAILLLFTYIPTDIHAFEAHGHTADAASALRQSGSAVNPLFQGAVRVPSSNAGADRVSTQERAVTAGDIRYTLEDAANELRQAMIRRESEIAITYPADALFDANAIWEVALSVTGDPKAGDYLAHQWFALAWNHYADVIGGKQYYTTVYYPEYFTTAAQEAQMDIAVADLLAKLDLGGKSDYDKICALYDWICDNVTYDHKNLNNDSYILKYSAYAALIHKTAVCQGYSLLFYRLCMEAGISVRYISGDTPEGSHSWNIVGIDGVYYYVDATWDAARKQVGHQYRWFLCGSTNFPDHAPDDEFLGADFAQTYRISAKDYGAQISWPITGSCGSALTWSLTDDGVLTISGSGEMDDYYLNDPGWQDYVWHIRHVIIEDGVKSIGAYAFFQHDSLLELTVLGSTVIKEAAFIYCTALKRVSISAVTALDDFAFFGCLSLEEFEVGKNLASIGQQVFADCLNLGKISVHAENQQFCAVNNVLFTKDMKRLIFAGCELSGSYFVPETVRVLDPYAFSSCANITRVTIPEGVVTLPYALFYWCEQLTQVDLPDSITHINDRAFSGCSSLSEIRLPASLTHIGYEAFANCALTSVTIPAMVTLIGELAFSHCNHLETVYFMGNVPDIADDSFTSVFADA
jgi:transglutaminase-like putative cysteine protease